MRMLQIRSAQAADARDWLGLWQAYCVELDGRVSEEATNGLWHRILSPDEPIGSLLALSPEGEVVAFANFVLHPHTWSLRPICYLEDLFVTSTARGTGAGRALIEALVSLGREHDWRRVYWHTRADDAYGFEPPPLYRRVHFRDTVQNRQGRYREKLADAEVTAN